MGKLWNLEEKYKDLVKLNKSSGEATDGDDEGFQRSDMLVAFPDPHMLEVGMTQEPWELPVYQYADATLTLTFPASDVARASLESALAESFVDQQSFGRSVHRKSFEKSLMQFFMNKGDQGDDGGSRLGSRFNLMGLDLLEAEIGMVRRSLASSSSSSSTQSSRTRYLRSRKLQREQGEDSTNQEESSSSITYKFTTRGSYKPPPHDQFGDVVQQSINADSNHLVKTLQRSNDLPEFFADLEGADSRHLTAKAIPQNEGGGIPQKEGGGCHLGGSGLYYHHDDDTGMEAWAMIPVILLAGLISILMGFFLFRRVFVRRRNKVAATSKQFGHLDGSWRNKGRVPFVKSHQDSDEDDDRKMKKRKNRRGLSFKKKRGRHDYDMGGDSHDDSFDMRHDPENSSEGLMASQEEADVSTGGNYHNMGSNGTSETSRSSRFGRISHGYDDRDDENREDIESKRNTKIKSKSLKSRRKKMKKQISEQSFSASMEGGDAYRRGSKSSRRIARSSSNERDNLNYDERKKKKKHHGDDASFSTAYLEARSLGNGERLDHSSAPKSRRKKTRRQSSEPAIRSSVMEHESNFRDSKSLEEVRGNGAKRREGNKMKNKSKRNRT